jgi:hypothetical protein
MSQDEDEGPHLIRVQYLEWYNPRAGVQTITSALISRASAIQRAGRAGRTQPGVCYRLYTVEIYDNTMLDYMALLLVSQRFPRICRFFAMSAFTRRLLLMIYIISICSRPALLPDGPPYEFNCANAESPASPDNRYLTTRVSFPFLASTGLLPIRRLLCKLIQEPDTNPSVTSSNAFTMLLHGFPNNWWTWLRTDRRSTLY